MISSSLSKAYPIESLSTFNNKLEPLCSIAIASCSIYCPLIKNIKSCSVVSVTPAGADAVTAVKLAVVVLSTEAAVL